MTLRTYATAGRPSQPWEGPELCWTGTATGPMEHRICSGAKSWDTILPSYFLIHCSVINSCVHTGANPSFPPALLASVNIATPLVRMAVRTSQLPPFLFDPFEPLLDGNLEICFSALQCAHLLELSIYYRFKKKKKIGITTDGSQLEIKTDTNFCWLQFQLGPG